MKFKRLDPFCFGAFALLLALGGQASAATYTWDAGGQNGLGGTPSDGSDIWSTSSANWWTGMGAGDIDWTAGADSAYFGATAGNLSYTATLGSNIAAAGITFATQNYTIAGDAGGLYGLSIGSGGIVANAPATIGAPVTLGAPQQWTSNSAGPFAVSGSIANAGNLLTLAGSGNSLLSGAISGGGGITFSGAGMLTLAGTNTYAGVTTVSSGTLQLQGLGSQSLGVQNSTVNLAGGALGFAPGSVSPVLGGLSGSGNIALATTAAQAVALSVGGNGQNTTYSGSLTGLGSLLKQGTGTLTLSATQGYGGSTIINGGMLQLQPPAGGAIGIHFSDLGSSVVTGSAGVVPMSNWNNLSLAANTQFTNQALTNSSSSATTATLSTANLVNNGTTGSGIQLLNGYIFTRNDEVLSATFSGIPYADYSIYAYVGDSTAYGEKITLGGMSYYYSTTNSSSYIPIANTTAGSYPAGNYAVATGLTGGTQTVTVTGVTAQYGSFTGFEIVSNAPTSILPATTPVTISSGGTLQMANLAQTVLSLSSTDGLGSQVQMGNGGLTIAGAAVTTFDGAISGAGGSLALQGGQLTLTGSNTYSGATTVSGGTLQLGSGASGSDGSLATSGVANNGTLAYDLFGSQTAAYGISGSGALVKNGGGSLTLSASSNFSGATAVLAGTLSLGTTGSVAQSPSISLQSGATFDVSQVASYHLASGQTLTGTGNFTVNGSMTANSGSVILAAGSGLFRTLSVGGLTLSPGSLLNYDIGSGSQDLIDVGAGGLTVNGGSIDLYQGNGTAAFNGLGTYTLMNYSGAFSGSAGALTVANAVAGDVYAFSSTGAMLSVTISALETWTGAGGGTFNWSNSANWSTLQAPVNGGAVVFSGTTGLSNSNDITNLNVAAMTFSSSAGAFSLSGNSIQLSGSVTNSSSNSQTIGMNIGLLNTSQSISASAGNIVVNGVVSDGGAGLGLNLSGTGAVVLGAANTYSGSTTLTAGTLNLAHSLAVQNSTVAMSGGALSFAAGITSPTLGGLTGSGNIALATTASEPVALNVGNNGQSTTYGGSLNGVGSLVKQGTGTLTLSATQGYGGSTIINGGVLQLQPASRAGGSIGVHFSDLGGSVVTGSAGVVPMSNWNNLSLAPNTQFTNQALTNSSSSATTATLSTANLVNNGTTGSGIQLLNGYIFTKTNEVLSATFSGIPYADYSIYAYVGDSTAYGEEITLGGMSYYYSTTNSSSYIPIANTTAGSYPAGNYAVATGLTGGTQTVTVTGVTNQYGSFTGFEIVNTTPSGILPAGTPVTISSGGTLDMTNVAQTILSLSSTDGMGSQVLLGNGALTVAGPVTTTFDGVMSDGGAGGSLVLQGGQLTLTGSNTYSGATTVSAGTLQLGTGQSGQDGSIANTSGITDNGALVYNLYGSRSPTYAISGSGNVTVSGPGFLNLSASNGYSGGTQIQNGTLQIGSTAALGTGALADNGGTLDLNGYAITVPSFSGAAGVVTDTTSTGTTPFYVNQSASTTFGGSFQQGSNGGLVGLNLENSGTLTLTGSSTVHSAIVQNTAMLVVNGTLNVENFGFFGSPYVPNSSGSQLAGSGSIVLTTGGDGFDYASSAASTFGGDISGPNTGGLEVDSGTLTLSGTNTYTGGTVVDDTGTLILTNSEALADGSSLTVGDASAFGAALPAAAPAITAVPEPSTLLLLAFGLGSAAIYRRFSKRSARLEASPLE